MFFSLSLHFVQLYIFNKNNIITIRIIIAFLLSPLVLYAAFSDFYSVFKLIFKRIAWFVHFSLLLFYELTSLGDLSVIASVYLRLQPH